MKVLSFEEVEHDLTRYAAHVHALNAVWWHDAEGNRLVRSHPQMLALVMSELGEALEGLRKSAMDDHLPKRPSLSVELADTVIRLLDYAGMMSLELHRLAPYRWDVEPSRHLWDIMVKVAELPDCRLHSVGAEITDIICECISLAETVHNHHPFWDVVYEKLCYNQRRADHKHEARALAGGKKF